MKSPIFITSGIIIIAVIILGLDKSDPIFILKTFTYSII